MFISQLFARSKEIRQAGMGWRAWVGGHGLAGMSWQAWVGCCGYRVLRR
ncbi:hypothetical protein H4S14_001823 [Agrobacterium vitis]|nr:hypothetical protein [Agrobacterium vitis]MBE1438078.1 hypothetical protein [Agrobacterium vitis]